MPRAKEGLKVAIEQSTDGDERTVVVRLTASAKDFVLPDLLSEQGAIDPYEVKLREAVKGATEGYFRGARDAVAAIVERKQGRQVGEPARPPKQKDVSKEAGQKRAMAPAEAGQVSGQRPSPERVTGPVTV